MAQTGDYEWEQRERTYLAWGAGLATKDLVLDVAFEFSPRDEEVVYPDGTKISSEMKQLNIYFSSIYKF